MQRNYDNSVLRNRIIAAKPLDLSSFCMRSGKSHIGYSLLRDAVRSGMDFDVAYKKIFNTESPTKMFVTVEYLNPEQERRLLEMIPELSEGIADEV